MTGLDVAARIALHEGDLHVLVRDGRRTGMLFTDGEGAGRFASILGHAEGSRLTVEAVGDADRHELLHELAWRDAEVMVDPEYVVGEGPVAARAPAHLAKSVLTRGLAQV